MMFASTNCARREGEAGGVAFITGRRSRHAATTTIARRETRVFRTIGRLGVCQVDKARSLTESKQKKAIIIKDNRTSVMMSDPRFSSLSAPNEVVKRGL